MTKSFTAGSFASASAESAPGTITTASNSTDGAPATASSGSSTESSDSVTPPTLGATTDTMTPALVAVSRTAATRSASAPSDSSIPILRPAKLSGLWASIDTAGEGGRSVRTGTAGSEASGSGMPSWSATAAARSSSTLRRLAITRVRTSGMMHLPSSKA